MRVKIAENRYGKLSLLGKCQQTSLWTSYNREKSGQETRIITGSYRGKPHAWVEYKQGDKWFIDDPEQDIVGWTPKECKDYYKPVSIENPKWFEGA